MAKHLSVLHNVDFPNASANVYYPLEYPSFDLSFQSLLSDPYVARAFRWR